MEFGFMQLRAVAKQICHLCDNYGNAKDPILVTPEPERIPQDQRGPWMATANNLCGYGETPEKALGQLILCAWEQLRDRKDRAEKDLDRCMANLETADAWTGRAR